MRFLKLFCLSLFFFGATAAASPYSNVSDAVWQRIEPHLFPSDHPHKAILDKIFTSADVIKDVKSLKKAGFNNPKKRKYTHLVVTTHQQLPDLILKIYTHKGRTHKGKPEHHWWLKRIKGAELLRGEIAKRGLVDYFKVPKKWLYPLPRGGKRNFILIEEEMNILPNKENKQRWRSRAIDKELLTAFFFLVTDLGMWDCAKPDNAPFGRDGKIAFIDTQTYYKWPVAYKKLKPYLSVRNKKLWRHLVNNFKS